MRDYRVMSRWAGGEVFLVALVDPSKPLAPQLYPSLSCYSPAELRSMESPWLERFVRHRRRWSGRWVRFGELSDGLLESLAAMADRMRAPTATAILGYLTGRECQN